MIRFERLIVCYISTSENSMMFCPLNFKSVTRLKILQTTKGPLQFCSDRPKGLLNCATAGRRVRYRTFPISTTRPGQRL